MTRPPSTISVWPVTKLASSLTRKVTAPAISLGWPTRPSAEGGIDQPPLLSPVGEASASRSMAIQPGETPLTRTPMGAPSQAKAITMASHPALAMQ